MSKTGKAELTARKVMEEIEHFRHPVGFRLDSVRNIARRFAVSPETAAKALALLVADGTLRSESRRGIFVNRAPLKRPAIGYAGHLPQPGALDPLLRDAAEKLLDFLAGADCDSYLITHRDLCNPQIGRQKLAALDAVILSYSFIDPQTLPQLREFRGKLILAGSTFIAPEFSCSQTLPDYVPALEEFRRRFEMKNYDRVLMLTASHPDARGLESEIRRKLVDWNFPGRVETERLTSGGNSAAEMYAFKFFSQARQEDFLRTLVCSLSGYFSHGIHEASKGNRWCPDVLSFDNLEGHIPDFIAPEPYFTAVDRELTRCYLEAGALALKMVREKDEKNYIVKIPCRLIVRKSIRGTLKFNLKGERE